MPLSVDTPAPPKNTMRLLYLIQLASVSFITHTSHRDSVDVILPLNSPYVNFQIHIDNRLFRG